MERKREREMVGGERKVVGERRNLQALEGSQI